MLSQLAPYSWNLKCRYKCNRDRWDKFITTFCFVFWPTQSDGRGQTQPDQHHRVQGPGRVERHAGVHLQQRGNQSDGHGQTSSHQEEAAACGETGEDRIQVKNSIPQGRVKPDVGELLINVTVVWFRCACRRLWQHVTKSLKEGNIDEATEHKHRLEERQRGEERQRAADNKPWTPKFFTKEVQWREIKIVTVIQGWAAAWCGDTGARSSNSPSAFS